MNSVRDFGGGTGGGTMMSEMTHLMASSLTSVSVFGTMSFGFEILHWLAVRVRIIIGMSSELIFFKQVL